MTVKLGDIEVEDYLADCAHVEPLALQEEFVRWTGDYSYWNERYAKASRLYASCKLERECLGAQLSLEIWATAEAEVQQAAAVPLDPKKKPVKVKLPTVGEVESRVLLDKGYQLAKEAESDAEVEMERLNGVLQALRGKRDMVLQLGYTQRVEMQGDPVLRDFVRGQGKGGGL
jgi:hypothetical protein